MSQVDRGINYSQVAKVVGGKAQLNKILQDAGYDGITHVGGNLMGNGHNHRVWIAFEPNQIKSVDNQGTFDASDDRMKYSRDRYAGLFDEAKHPRDHGKFASKPGVAGQQMGLFHGDEQAGQQKTLFNVVKPTSKKKMVEKIQASLLERIEDDLKKKSVDAKPIGGQKELFSMRNAFLMEHYNKKNQTSLKFEESKHPRASDGRFGSKPGEHTAKQSEYKSRIAAAMFRQMAAELSGKQSVDAVDNSPIGAGDFVQWQPQGTSQFTEPKRVAHVDGDYAFLDGSMTGVPVAELSKWQASRQSVTPKQQPEQSSPAPKEADAKAVNVGDFVQWAPGGVKQFPESKRVVHVQDGYAFLDGSMTAVPVSELEKDKYARVKDKPGQKDLFSGSRSDMTRFLMNQHGADRYELTPQRQPQVRPKQRTERPKQVAASEKRKRQPGDGTPGWQKVGGSRVFVNGDGKITKGCPGLKGEHVSDLIDESDDSRDVREVRQAHAKAEGLTGDEYTAKDRRRHQTKQAQEQHANAKEAAKQHGVATHKVLATMPEAHGIHSGQNADIESARQRARQMTGLNAGRIAKIENNYRDHSTVPGFEQSARDFASERPDLFDKHAHDTPAKVWEFIREGEQDQGSARSLDTAHAAAELIRNRLKPLTQPVSETGDDDGMWSESEFEDDSFDFGQPSTVESLTSTLAAALASDDAPF